jgi:hypothetical protein
MPSYRLFCYEGTRISRGEIIESVDEMTVIEMVRRRHSDEVCEIWAGDRLVARLTKGGLAVMSDPPT